MKGASMFNLSASKDAASEILSSEEQEELQPDRRLLARMERLPYLPFHRRLTLILGSGLLLDGFDALIVSSILVAVITSLKVSLAEAGVLIASGYVGQVVGAPLFGYLSEKYGRKILFILSLVCFGLLSLLAAFVPTFSLLLLVRMLQGIGLGGCPPTATVLYNEFLPTKTRGKNALVLQIATSLGYIIAPIAALLVFALLGADLGWRLLFGVGALPLLVAPLAYFLVPESARWLQIKNRSEEAEQIVARIEAEAVRLKKPFLEEPQVDISLSSLQQRTRSGELFSPNYRRRTALIWIMWCTGTFVLVGYSSWLTTLYISLGGLSQSQSLFLTSLYGVIALGFLVIFTLTCDRVGRKRWFLIGFAMAALGAASGVIGGFLHLTNWIVLATAGLLMSLGSLACGVGMYLYASELFPTRMRSWAISTGRSWGTVASIVGPLAIGGLVNAHLGIESIFLILFTMALIGLVTVITIGEETKLQSLEALAS
jgi:putative MFS transporter